MKKHELDYAQALKIFAALTRQIGHKIEDEEGAAMALIQQLTKLMPTLLEKSEVSPNAEVSHTRREQP